MQKTVSPVSRRMLAVIAIVVAYVITRLIYRTTGIPFSTLAEQSTLVRFGADLGMWLLICAIVYGSLVLITSRARADRPPVNS